MVATVRRPTSSMSLFLLSASTLAQSAPGRRTSAIRFLGSRIGLTGSAVKSGRRLREVLPVAGLKQRICVDVQRRHSSDSRNRQLPRWLRCKDWLAAERLGLGNGEAADVGLHVAAFRRRGY